MSENLDNLLVEAFSKNLFKDNSNEDVEDGQIDREEGEIDSGDDNKHKHKDKHKKTKIKVKSSKHKSKIKPKIDCKLAKDKYYALKKLSKAKTRLKSTKTGSKTNLKKSSKSGSKSDSKSKSKIKKSKSSDKSPKSVKKTDKNGYETDSEVMKLLLSKQLRSYADIQFKDEELSPEEEIPKKSSKHKSSKRKDEKPSDKSKRHKKSKHSDDYYEFQKDSYYPSHSSTSHEDYFYGSYYEGMEEDSLRGSRSRGYSRPLSPLHESEWRYRSRSPLDYSRESDHNSSHYDRRRSISPEERSYRDRQRSVTPFYKDGYSKPYRHSRRSVSPGNRSYRSGSVSSVGSSSSCRSVNKVDKQKLLEIARINLIKMIEKGDLPKGTDINKLKLKHLRELTTQKSVQQWTEFCRAISTLDSGIYDSDLDSDSDNDDIKSVASDQPFSIRHPFKLTERKDIQIRVRGFQQLASRTAKEMAIELREQFPVSSGNQHRRKELEWHEVDPIPAPLAICAAPKKAKKIETKLTEILNTPKTIPDEQRAYKIIAPTPHTIPPTISTTSTDCSSINSSDALPEASSSTEVTTTEAAAASDAILMPPPPPPPPLSTSSSAISSTSDIVGAPVITPVTELQSNSESTDSPSNVSQTTDSVFPQSSMTIDIGSVMAQRLSAMRKLQEDPHNVVALKQMYQANQMMTEWAESKIVPGQYTGSTGANILSPEQLTGSYNAWTRKDQLKTAAPITGGIGMLLLLKMGWSPGQGLGKNNEGSVNPIMLDIKTDKKGLVAEEEQVRNLPLQLVTSGPPVANSKFLSKPGKNPVSILHELCAKKKWNQPEYEIVNEMGPDHRKNFTFKVLLNGVEYQPSVSSGNKKQAKALAAGVCLQAFGLLPKDNI